MYPYMNIGEEFPDYVYFDEHEQSFALGEKVFADGLDSPHEIRGYRPYDNYYALDMGEETMWFPENMISRRQK